MYEEVEGSAIPNRQNESLINNLEEGSKSTDKKNDEIEKPVDAEECFEEASGGP